MRRRGLQWWPSTVTTLGPVLWLEMAKGTAARTDLEVPAWEIAQLGSSATFESCCLGKSF